MGEVDQLAAAAAELSIEAADGYELHYTHLPAANRRRSAIVAIHGAQSHAGWYGRSCERLAQAGHDVYFFDRRGSGLNQVDRGHCPGGNQLIDDVVRAVKHVRREVGDVPVFLLSISWGGKLALMTLKKNPDLVDGVMFLCPGWFAKVWPSMREKLAIGWSYLFWPHRRLPIPLGDPALFTGSDQWQRFIREDPLSLRLASAKFLMTSWFWDGEIRDAGSAITIPALLMLGGEDRIIKNERTRTFFEAFASRDKQVIHYPEAHHTLEFEPDPDRFVDDLLGWISEHLRR
ncbi:Phospholipase YtpA [Planctomycetes bacterium Pan216]|uniref:Phospholipase YtpA n=1 Tax=Kolteria novifilia TaxID=2527975 RepID=A0A518B8Y2_9BACT|nr:Phospholipase YtpA [Planctomycetes bacterium Pan216]